MEGSKQKVAKDSSGFYTSSSAPYTTLAATTAPCRLGHARRHPALRRRASFIRVADPTAEQHSRAGGHSDQRTGSDRSSRSAARSAYHFPDFEHPREAPAPPRCCQIEAAGSGESPVRRREGPARRPVVVGVPRHQQPWHDKPLPLPAPSWLGGYGEESRPATLIAWTPVAQVEEGVEVERSDRINERERKHPKRSRRPCAVWRLLVRWIR